MQYKIKSLFVFIGVIFQFIGVILQFIGAILHNVVFNGHLVPWHRGEATQTKNEKKAKLAQFCNTIGNNYWNNYPFFQVLKLKYPADKIAK